MRTRAEEKDFLELIAQFDDKIKYGRNFWIENDLAEFYIRKASHIIPHLGVLPCIDIANVAVFEEHQRKGFFRDMLAHVERYASNRNRVVYIENVLNPILGYAMVRRGYTLFEVAGNKSYYHLQPAIPALTLLKA